VGAIYKSISFIRCEVLGRGQRQAFLYIIPREVSLQKRELAKTNIHRQPKKKKKKKKKTEQRLDKEPGSNNQTKGPEPKVRPLRNTAPAKCMIYKDDDIKMYEKVRKPRINDKNDDKDDSQRKSGEMI